MRWHSAVIANGGRIHPPRVDQFGPLISDITHGLAYGK